MVTFDTLLLADLGQLARTITLLDNDSFSAWWDAQAPQVQLQIKAAGFTGAPDSLFMLAGEKEEDWIIAAGVTSLQTHTPWCLAAAASLLPEGQYRVDGLSNNTPALGWLLAQHQFAGYKQNTVPQRPRVLLSTHVNSITEQIALARATARVRDLVNSPPNICDPAELERCITLLAAQYGGEVTITKNGALEAGFPLVHAVGQAATATRAPRMLELTWGDAKHPKLAIIGKGVCFDTGGINLKPSSAVRLMKKDMGGAATALALAELLMEMRLPYHIHLLIPAVENALGGAAFRPGDILTSRAGLSIEVDNTDAEGRLVLADALTKAQEDSPALILNFATLTGAARVALGPDIPACFTPQDSLWQELEKAAAAVSDPIWRLPLWQDYVSMLHSDHADMANSSDSGFAGAVLAGLFLQKFMQPHTPWLHFDIYAWNYKNRHGRPKGGEAMALRAVYALLKARKRLKPQK
jgi:leucyl aminopeptidase